MKKVFLSVPMRGRTKENIEKSLQKMKAYAMIAFPEGDLEFVNTEVKDESPKGANEAIWRLGKSIQKLAEADIVITVDCPYFLRSSGVETEQRVFREYHERFGEFQKLDYIELPVALVMSSDEFDQLYKEYQRSENGCCDCCAPSAPPSR